MSLLAVRVRLLYLHDGVRIYGSQMFLLCDVLLNGVLGMNRFIYGSGILPSVLQNNLFAAWMQLQDTAAG